MRAAASLLTPGIFFSLLLAAPMGAHVTGFDYRDQRIEALVLRTVD
jgi:hypothetical protein